MEIKFRKKDLVKTMRRLDTVYANLAEQLGKRRVFQFAGIDNSKRKHEAQTPSGNPLVFLCENSLWLF